MRSIAYSLPPLPFLSPPRTYASWPVWRDSTRSPVKYQPLSKRHAVHRWYDARRLERQTRQPGHQDGVLGRNGLAVLHALLFDFIDYATGRLDPSHARIAQSAAISLRSVARGMAKLRAAGVLHWLRRCLEDRDEEGRYRLRQQSNAYSVLPQSQWHGFVAVELPPVEPWQLGAVPPLREGADAAADVRANGGTIEEALRHMVEASDPITAAIGRWFTVITGGQTP